MNDQSPDLDEAMQRSFSGSFVGPTDLMSRGNVLVTICGVTAPGTEFDSSNKLIDRPILSFERASKRLIVGKTNLKILRMQHGDKGSAWVGKQITLCVRYLERAFGEFNVPTVRIVPPDDKPLPYAMRKYFGAATPFTNLTSGGQ